MDNIQDRIFGDLNTLDNRVNRHLQELAGVHHALRRVPMNPQPGEPVVLQVKTAGPELFSGVYGWYTTGEAFSAENHTREVRFERVSAAWDHVLWGYVQTWEAVIPPQKEGVIIRYRIGAVIPGGSWRFADNQAVERESATDFAFLVTAAGVPFWAREALVYHIFIDRFNPGAGKDWLSPSDPSGFYGGTLRGVIERLEYIRDLGFTTIWLSPLFPSPSHHGYDATDYLGVEPRLGTREDLLELISEAHNRGLRVILDFVANHWSRFHPTFQEARTDRNSPYYSWYTWDRWPDEYRTYFDVKNMPQLNLKLGSPARAHLLEVAQHWLERGVDGYRLDYANGPPDDFWVDFRRACRAVDPDCWLFGEIVHTADRQASYLGAFDGILDFHLAYALRQTFASQGWDFEEFEAFLQAHEAYFPEGIIRPAFLDNHDMNRFLYLAGGDASSLKLAALVLFTLPQPPIVYYGTEVGVTQERPIHQGERGIFEEARLPMIWGDAQDDDLRDYFSRLAALRRNAPALVYGDRQLVHLDQAAQTYAYLRTSDRQKVLVAFNASGRSQPVRIAVTLPHTAVDRLGNQKIYLEDEGAVLDLAPRTGAVVF